VKRPAWLIWLTNLPIHGFARLVLWLVRVLPPRASFALGKGLALTAWWSMPRWRKTARRNLKLFFGDELTPRECARIGRASAVHLGYYVIEFARMGFLPVDQALAMVVETEGVEHYEQALKQGRGVIGLAMHYGNWDLSGAYVTQRIRQLYAVGKLQRDRFFSDLAFPRRARFGIKNIFAGKRANSAILKALRENCVLGLLADQNGGTTGTFAPFVGTPASTVPGPAVLALKTGAPLMVTFTRRIAPGKLKFIIKPPVDLSDLPEGKEARIIEVLARMNQAYEAVIREQPEQWLWGHKRWKTRPPGEKWLY